MKEKGFLIFASLTQRSSNIMVMFLVIAVCLFASKMDALEVNPSSTQSDLSPIIRPTVTTATAGNYGSISTITPTPSPLPKFTKLNCSVGPDTQVSERFLILTNSVYLDITERVNCSGAITTWSYCHYLIGFRSATSELWPCVWRRSNTSDGEMGYENMGCNRLSIIPGDGDSFRCGEYSPSDPAEIITVEEGDYIGFYVPDSALLPGLAVPTQDKAHYQLVRNETGFTNFIKDTELRHLLCTPNCGRAILKAEIGESSIDQARLQTKLAIIYS